jgi:hypothetical protein
MLRLDAKAFLSHHHFINRFCNKLIVFNRLNKTNCGYRSWDRRNLCLAWKTQHEILYDPGVAKLDTGSALKR